MKLRAYRGSIDDGLENRSMMLLVGAPLLYRSQRRSQTKGCLTTTHQYHFITSIHSPSWLVPVFLPLPHQRQLAEIGGPFTSVTWLFFLCATLLYSFLLDLSWSLVFFDPDAIRLRGLGSHSFRFFYFSCILGLFFFFESLFFLFLMEVGWTGLYRREGSQSV